MTTDHETATSAPVIEADDPLVDIGEVITFMTEAGYDEAILQAATAHQRLLERMYGVSKP